MKRLTVDKDGAVGAGSNEIAGEPDHTLGDLVADTNGHIDAEGIL
jgi:hypothetical protein